MIKELVKMANHLDSIGHPDLADSVDSVVVKVSNLDIVTDIDGNPFHENSDEEEAKMIQDDAEKRWGDQVNTFDDEMASLDDLSNELENPDDLDGLDGFSVEASKASMKKRASMISDLSRLFSNDKSHWK